MEHPAGESDDASLRVDFDRRLKLFPTMLGAIAALRPDVEDRRPE
jgi:hypothetical protein